jgi:hypothetical protein
VDLIWADTPSVRVTSNYPPRRLPRWRLWLRWASTWTIVLGHAIGTGSAWTFRSRTCLGSTIQGLASVWCRALWRLTNAARATAMTAAQAPIRARAGRSERARWLRCEHARQSRAYQGGEARTPRSVVLASAGEAGASNRAGAKPGPCCAQTASMACAVARGSDGSPTCVKSSSNSRCGSRFRFSLGTRRRGGHHRRRATASRAKRERGSSCTRLAGFGA